MPCVRRVTASRNPATQDLADAVTASQPRALPGSETARSLATRFQLAATAMSRNAAVTPRLIAKPAARAATQAATTRPAMRATESQLRALLDAAGVRAGTPSGVRVARAAEEASSIWGGGAAFSRGGL